MPEGFNFDQSLVPQCNQINGEARSDPTYSGVKLKIAPLIMNTHIIMKDIKCISLILTAMLLYGCEVAPVQKTPVTPRTIVLNGVQFRENEPGEFDSWKCRDYSHGGKTVVEVGRLFVPEGYDVRQLPVLDDHDEKLAFLYDYNSTSWYKQLEDKEKKAVDERSKDVHKEIIEKLNSILGFVLYDGTNTGDIATYERAGINHRWDWKSESSNYAFRIKPDGTGLYYDFSTADENGIKSQADDIFKCNQK